MFSQLFVNISTTLKYFPTKVYIFWVSIEFLCWRCNSNKQGGISRFKNDVDFLISSNMSIQFYFFRIKVTLQYATYLGLKNITRFFKKTSGLGNTLETWPLRTDRTYNCQFWQYTGDFLLVKRTILLNKNEEIACCV